MQHDRDAERAVLAAAMYAGGAEAVCGGCALEHFYAPAHAIAFELIGGLVANGEVVDRSSVLSAALQAGKRRQIGTLDEIHDLRHGASVETLPGHIARLETARKGRAIETACRRATARIEDAPGEVAAVLSELQATLDTLSRSGESGGLRHVKEAVKARLVEMEAEAEGAPSTAVPTGLVDLDRAVEVKPSKLIVIAARPAMGKSALALGFGLEAAHPKRGGVVALHSLEMSDGEVVNRMLSMWAQVDSDRIQRPGGMEEYQWRKVTRAAMQACQSGLYTDDTPSQAASYILAECRALKRKAGRLDLVLVDYGQLLDIGEAEGREKGLSQMVRSLKVLARTLDVPVILLAQLNRKCEERKDKRPLLSDLRETGAFEQDADAVLMVYRDEYYNENSDDKGIAEILVRKNRGGATGTIKVRWNGPQTTFSNLSREDER